MKNLKLESANKPESSRRGFHGGCAACMTEPTGFELIEEA